MAQAKQTPQPSAARRAGLKELGTQDIDVSLIDMGKRLRAISQPHAQMLAVMIDEDGHREPIEIRVMKGGRFRLIAGGHRFTAIRDVLKWPKIRARLFEASDDEARLAEIDENLFRFELNPLDRAVFLAERKAIYERLHPETKRGGDRRSNQREMISVRSFAADTAKKVNLTARTIRLSVSIASGLSAETRTALAGTAFANKQSDLVALAKLAPSQQKRAIAGLTGASPKWRSLKQAIDAIGGRTAKPARSPYDAALAAVLRLTPKQQRQLVEQVAQGLKPREAAE